MTTKRLLNIAEIKAYFSRYAAQVMKGKSFIIAHRNKPFAELRPLNPPTINTLNFGLLKNQFKVPADFDAPLPQFEKELYGQ